MKRESSQTTGAVVFADICGSTRLYETLGDSAAREVIFNCFGELQGVTRQYGGKVVKTIGDEILCIFPSAESAVQATIEFQELLSHGVHGAGEQSSALSIKVGLQYGATIQEADDVFGDAVNVAARMVSFAKGGQIITTRETVNALPMRLQNSTRHLDTTAVKGKQHEIEIHEVVWEEGETTRMLSGLFNMETARTRLVLRYREEAHVLEQHCEPFMMGRYRRADLTVHEQLVSREHAKIEWRRGKFVLVDSSTNGTYALVQGRTVRLRREDVALSGEGRIILGRHCDEEGGAVIDFKCESIIDSKPAGQLRGTNT